MSQAPKKVIYVDVDDPAVCRSDGTIIPPKVRSPLQGSRPVLIFGERDPNVEELDEQDEGLQPEEGS